MDLKGKRLLVQGASRGNLGLVKAAKEEGVFIVMTGLGGDFPCNPYADKFCYADISDPDAVLKVALEEKIEGAVICCSDTGLRGVGRCNDVLGLSGITEEAALLSSNKLYMKQKLVSAGVRTAKFSLIHSLEGLEEAISSIGFPAIIKATDLQGSRGINIVKKVEDLRPAFLDTMSQTKKDYCIVEEFLSGREFGAQSFVYKGEVRFVLPHGDETIMCKTAVPIGHYMPYEISPELYKDTVDQVTRAIRAVGLDNCAVNVDLIERDGKAYILELTGRVGANCLPELTGNYLGTNYYEMILKMALGENPMPLLREGQKPCATLARMIRSDQAGVCREVFVPSLEDTEIHMFIHKGSPVRSFTNSNDAVGEVIVKGETLQECEDKIRTALEKIKIIYE